MELYFARGYTKFCSGDFKGAVEDLRYHYEHNDQSEMHSNYSVITTALAMQRQRLSTTELLQWWTKFQGVKWPLPVLDFLRGKTTAEAVLKAAGTDRGSLTEA